MKIRKRALITGASGVIGSAIAALFAENGIDVVLHYNKNKHRIMEIEQQCNLYGADVHIIQADLADPNGIKQLSEYLANSQLLPDILVNSIGIPHYGLIQDVSYAEWQNIINTNLMSTFFITQKLLPEMIKNRDGRIINISSVWGSTGAANEVLYSMTKGAIDTFTKALAKELAPSNITVNAIAPGVVISPMVNNLNEEELDALKSQIPANRFAEPLEIAECALYLASSNSSYLTGQIITISGGWV